MVESIAEDLRVMPLILEPQLVTKKLTKNSFDHPSFTWKKVILKNGPQTTEVC
jgi:hypothetical protein